MKDAYEALRERLDDMAVGFPATESGVEIRILKKLFTESEAALFVKLAPLPQSPKDIAEKLGRKEDELAAQLEEMAQKGLLFRVRRGERVRYAAVPYVVGIYEFQLNKMDESFARDHEEYFETAFGRKLQGFQTPVLRSIPIDRQLTVDYPVAPFEDVLSIIEEQEIIAVAPCVCRTTKQLVGEPCDKPVERCFLFGSHAAYYVENNMVKITNRDDYSQYTIKYKEGKLYMDPEVIDNKLTGEIILSRVGKNEVINLKNIKKEAAVPKADLNLGNEELVPEVDSNTGNKAAMPKASLSIENKEQGRNEESVIEKE